MSKDKLLSDEELEEAVSVALMGYGVRDDALLKRMHKESMSLAEARSYLKNIINTQKKLYAESVIGEDEPITDLDYDWSLIETSRKMNGAKPYHFIEARNIFRAEQRARIK